jgi:thymidylate synthase (FAD)
MTKEQIIVQLNPDVPPTGSDLGIVNAARKSFGKRSEWELTDKKTNQWTIVQGDSSPQYYELKDKDKRLLEFLARGMTADDFDEFLEEVSNTVCTDDATLTVDRKALTELLWGWRNTPTHDTPFSHGFFSFEVKAPIFVARHLVKHEYLIMSEYSRRYITEDVEFYEPDWRGKAEDVKQGSVEYPDDVSGASTKPIEWIGVDVGTHEFNTEALSRYQWMVDIGIAPEQARMVLPQSLMTSWTWSGTLGAFASMCKLRLGKDTQAETRYVAEKVYEELKKQFPIAAPLLVEGVY